MYRRRKGIFALQDIVFLLKWIFSKYNSIKQYTQSPISKKSVIYHISASGPRYGSPAAISGDAKCAVPLNLVKK
jgi:hypothetical protein